MLLTQEAWNEISRHAQETFPEECCGVIFSACGADCVLRLKNIQNKLHALDPQTYPRTAAIAYAVDPLELESVIRQSEEKGQTLKAFYHSHPDHPARPSQFDLDHAWPTFAYVIVSVASGAARDMTVWYLKEDRSNFEEGELHGDENSDPHSAPAVHR